MISFDKVFEAVSKKNPKLGFQGILAAFDPGETTGACIFQGPNLKVQTQLKTWPITDAVTSFQAFLDEHKPEMVVFESYQVYEWKAEDHTWSQIPTVQVIGCLQTILIQRQIPYTTQTAQVAKHFCTDEKLKGWNFWIVGQRHARDAIRHACYWLLFGTSKAS